MPTVYRTKDRDGNFHTNWRIRFLDWQGIRQSMVGLPSKKETQKLAWKIQAEQDEIRKGLRPPPTESEKPRLYRDVADEYLDWGTAQGGHHGRPWSPVHADTRIRYLKFWEVKLELKWLSELVGSLARIEKVLREFQSETSRHTKKRRAGKTIQNCSETIAAFCDWCVDREYLKEDPLKRLQAYNTDPTWFRRAITLEEAQAILAVASPERRLIYLVAMITGLRAGEMRKLIVKDFREGLLLRPTITKNGREGFQPLHQQVIEELTRVSQGKGSNELLLQVPKRTAAMLYEDMKKADVPVWTDEGKLDFHALRTSFATFVIETGANAKETQSLLRHSTPDLTMKIYARARKHPLQGVVSEIGDRLLGTEQSQTNGKQDHTLHADGDGNQAGDRPSAIDNGGESKGSNPRDAVGHGDATFGPNPTQLRQQQEVTTDSTVNQRTGSDAGLPTLGQVRCQTDGKPIPDAVKKLADIWNQLTEDVRQSIQFMTLNTGVGYSGFSGHCSGTTRPPIAGFSGFSGFLNAA